MLCCECYNSLRWTLKRRNNLALNFILKCEIIDKVRNSIFRRFGVSAFRRFGVSAFRRCNVSLIYCLKSHRVERWCPALDAGDRSRSFESLTDKKLGADTRRLSSQTGVMPVLSFGTVRHGSFPLGGSAFPIHLVISIGLQRIEEKTGKQCAVSCALR